MGYIKEIYYQGGLKQFYKGLPITTIRSMIVSVTSLYVYENIHKSSYEYLGGKDWFIICISNNSLLFVMK